MMISNALWLLCEKLVKLVGAVVIGALIARHLQPEGFGTLNFYLACISILAIASSLGFNRIVVREIVNSNELKVSADVVATSFYLRLIASLFVFVVAVLITFVFIDEHSILLAVTAFICVVFNATEILDFYQQGISKFKVVSVVRLAAFSASAVIKLVFVYKELEILWFLVANLVEYLIAAILIYKYCARNDSGSLLSIGSFRVNKAKNLLAESWPEIVSGLSAILLLKLDQLLLFYLAGEAEVGVYSAAARLSEAWYFIPTAIISATFPRLAMLRHVSMDKYQLGIKYLFTFMFFLSITAVLFVSIFGELFIAVIFGELYQKSADVLIVHTWASIFLCIGLVSGSWIVAEKKLKLNLYRNFFGLIVNFLANVILIPKYGAVGAAWAMVIALFSANVLFSLFVKDLRWIFIETFVAPFRVVDKGFLKFLKANARR